MKTAQQLVDILLESDLDNLVTIEQVLKDPKLALKYAYEMWNKGTDLSDELVKTALRLRPISRRADATLPKPMTFYSAAFNILDATQERV